MKVVINHLYFREPVTETLTELMQDAMRQIVDAGGKAARVLKVNDTHLVLLLDFQSQDDADRISSELGGPLMREHIVPLLDRDTERSVGEVIASGAA